MVSPRNDVGGASGEIPSNTDDVSLPTSVSFFSDWSCREGNLLQPIKSTAQIWIVTRHQYGISALIPQTLFAGEPVVALRNVGRFLRLVKASSPHAISLLVQLVSRFPISAAVTFLEITVSFLAILWRWFADQDLRDSRTVGQNLC